MVLKILDDHAIREKFRDASVVVCGAGADGRMFYESYHDVLDIAFYVDNRVQDGHDVLEDKCVYPFLYLQAHRGNRIVIVATTKYASEISAQLERTGYRLGEDFYVWGGIYGDHNTQRFIAHNRIVWGPERRQFTRNKILIPYYEENLALLVLWSYYANTLAKKFDASIEACGIKTESISEFAEPVRAVYRSVNVNSFFTDTLTKEQALIANEIAATVSKRIWNKEDILHIEHDGIRLGYYIHNTFIRLVSPILQIDEYNSEIEKIVNRVARLLVFWRSYFENHRVKAVLMGDALYMEGLVGEIALLYDIPVYSVDNAHATRYIPGFYFNHHYDINYKTYFEQLPKTKQAQGIAWAKQKLSKHLRSAFIGKDIFTNRLPYRVLPSSDRIKVMICAHAISDDPNPYGEGLFHSRYDWLCFLGELSKKTNYEWYLKMHPIAETKEIEFYHDILERYPHIHLLPTEVSAVQLHEEGMQFALTLWGMMGYEYPLFGLQVISDGKCAPYRDFDFTIKAKTIDEYESILMNLDSYLNWRAESKEVYAFYSAYFLYNPPAAFRENDIFFRKTNLFAANRNILHKWNYNKNGMPIATTQHDGTEIFNWFLDDWTPARHKEILAFVETHLAEIDALYEDMMRRGLRA